MKTTKIQINLNKELKIGFFIITGLMIFYFGYNFLNNFKKNSKKNIYNIYYESANKLSVSNPVFLNGFEVGHVRNIDILPNKNCMVYVQIEVNKNITLYESSYAVIIDKDLLGSKAIQIELNPLKNVKILKNNDILNGKIAYGIKELFMEKAIPILVNIQKITDDLHCFINDFNEKKKIVDGTLENIYLISKNFNQIFDQIKMVSDQIYKTSNIPDTLKQINILLSNLNESNIGNIFQLLKDILFTVDQFTNHKNKNKSTLGLLLHDANIYKNLNSTIIALNLLLNDLRKEPKRYVHFSVFGNRNKSNATVDPTVINTKKK
jgi:phospholipid/cholesterol/gamma-HCH transport system substrate-binding protein